MKTDMKYTPEGDKQAQEAGTFVVLTDMWNSKDVPIEAATRRFHEGAADLYKSRDAQSFAAVFTQNPQMGAALQKAAEESKKIEGTAVKSTMYLVMLPPGLEFDRQLALTPEKDKEKGKGLKGAAKGALGGMLGRKKQEEEPEPEEQKPQQATLLSATTEIHDIQVKSLPLSLFEPPADYKEVPFTMNAK